MDLKIIISILLISYTINISSLSLEESISYAYNHRSELLMQNELAHFYSKQHEYSKYKLLPDVQAQAGHSLLKDNQYYSSLDGYVKDETYQLGEISLSSSLTLYDGFASVNKIKQNKLLIAKNESQTLTIKNTIKLEVIQAYYAALMANENISTIEASLASTNKQIKIINIAVESGNLSKIDLLELLAQQESEKARLINAQKKYKQTIITLKQTINYQEKEITIDTNDQLPITPSLNADSLFLQAISFLPEFKTADYDSLYWDYNIKQIKAGYLPFLSTTFALSSGYQNNAINLSEDTPNRDYKLHAQLEHNTSQQIGISLVIPLYSRHQVKQQLLESHTQQQNLIIEKAQLYADIYFQLERLCNEATYQKNYIKSLEQKLQYYKDIFTLRQVQYQHGTLSITDFIIADNNVKNNELILNYERYNLLYNLKVIEHYYGN